jgi:hypothetical protein
VRGLIAVAGLNSNSGSYKGPKELIKPNWVVELQKNKMME